jgi:hypothetical protein
MHPGAHIAQLLVLLAAISGRGALHLVAGYGAAGTTRRGLFFDVYFALASGDTAGHQVLPQRVSYDSRGRASVSQER